MDITFHYPPELLKLPNEAIPKLCKSKKDLLLFLQGAGVWAERLTPYQTLLRTNKEEFNKYRVTEELLTKLNELGEGGLRERREILRRVTEFQEYSLCWENDQQAARGLVAQIRDVVNVKDTFTRINIEREQERKQRVSVETAKADQARKRSEEFAAVKQQLFAVFGEPNPYKRGKALETALNRYFRFSDILVTEAITLKGEEGAGIVEQIDGVVELKSALYLTEMKWEAEPLGPDKVAPHLVRVFNRSMTGGIFISYSGYTAAAIRQCKEALRDKVIVLCKLEELVRALEQERDLKQFLHAKIEAAVIHKNPLFTPPS
jgi:restriction system protein